MTTIIAVFFALCILHFIYEGAIAPFLRLRIRLRLYALRDRLRVFESTHKSFENESVFEELAASINTSIAIVGWVTPSAVARADREFRRDPILQEAVQRRRDLVARSEIKAVQDIRRKEVRLVGWALAVNTAGSVPYATALVVPLFVALATVERIKEALRRLTFVGEDRVDWAGAPTPEATV